MAANGSYALIEQEPSGRERRTSHSWGSLDEQQLLPWPRVVFVEVGASDAMLYRYSSDGSFCGDTWHESEADAREMAEWEYEGLISEWRPVPDGVDDATAFAIEVAEAGG